MFKQGLNQSGSGGRLVIPKNSKWSLAAGICMIVALLFMLLFKPFLNYATIEMIFRVSMPRFIHFYSDEIINFFVETPIESALFILFFIGGFIVFIITSLLPQKNIKRYMIPLCLFIISTAIPYFSSWDSGFQAGMWREFWYVSKLFVFWVYLIFLISFLLYSAGKVSRRIATIICSCGIGFIWLMFLVKIVNVVNISHKLDSYPIPMFALLAVQHTLILTAFLMVLFNFKKAIMICSKCGAEITGKVKYCNICGESTDSVIIK